MSDRQARDLPLDAHLHTDLSPDSDVPIDVFAAQAVERGIPEIAITDHLDFEPGAPAYRYASFAERERSVREAAERWADRGVAIRFGVEITWDSRWADDIRDHLRRHAYDFTIGSVHVYYGSPYGASKVASWVAGRSLPEIVEPYFSEVGRAIRSGLFDAIGHLDVVKRYLAPHVTAADLAAAPELYEPLLHALVGSGTALEINTSGLRQEAKEIYPPAHIVARYRELGGERITVGSDAHRADTFAWALDDGYRVAAAAGFEALTFRRGDGSVVVPMATTPNAIAGRSL
ncbi:MAG TPA: histidinol-phosphatase HisJ family protein [Candidatus Limnocylindrales bacterium]|nr:histidinol-phosphatase HisJ family protein [Candidatus Limnocylindrales bacterium]